MNTKERYAYEITGETEHGGPQIAHVVAANETDAAQFVREVLDFELVNAVTKQFAAWLP